MKYSVILEGDKLVLQDCRESSKPPYYSVLADFPTVASDRDACSVLDRSYSLPKQHAGYHASTIFQDVNTFIYSRGGPLSAITLTELTSLSARKA